MRFLSAVTGAALFTCNFVGFAAPKVPCAETISAALQPRANLIIDSRPAGLHILGTDQEGIRVSCFAHSEENGENAHLNFVATSDGGRLSIEGTHLHHGDNGLEIKIEVPRRTNLRVRMFAGEVRVEEVKGNKDVDVGAGQITISSIHHGDYRSVDASVGVGEVEAKAFGADKGGFFRSFTRKNQKGEYQLNAHVTTGEIDLLGTPEQEDKQVKPD